MATASENLAALNSVLVLDVPTDRVAVAGVQYPVGGSGTIVLEATINEVDWVAVQMSVPGTLGGAGVANLAAAGIGFADVSWAEMVRVRKSVGTSDCNVTLTVTMP